MYIYSYNAHSESVKNLKEAMGLRKIRNTNSRFVGSRDKKVINYGSSNLPGEVLKCNVINYPNWVGTCSNKLSFFQLMNEGGPRIPAWTGSLDTVRQWIVEGHKVMARTVLQGHSGEGIIILEMNKPMPEGLEDCRLFTKYVKKKDEYRVHIVDGEIIDFARKALRNDVEPSPEKFLIRNYDNGFIYAREDVVLPEDVKVQALLAMEKSNLVFGAVDVIYNKSQDQAYVLEINSAPGMEGSTVTNYANALRSYANE